MNVQKQNLEKVTICKLNKRRFYITTILLAVLSVGFVIWLFLLNQNKHESKINTSEGHKSIYENLQFESKFVRILAENNSKTQQDILTISTVRELQEYHIDSNEQLLKPNYTSIDIENRSNVIQTCLIRQLDEYCMLLKFCELTYPQILVNVSCQFLNQTLGNQQSNFLVEQLYRNIESVKAKLQSILHYTLEYRPINLLQIANTNKHSRLLPQERTRITQTHNLQSQFQKVLKEVEIVQKEVSIKFRGKQKKFNFAGFPCFQIQKYSSQLLICQSSKVDTNKGHSILKFSRA